MRGWRTCVRNSFRKPSRRSGAAGDDPETGGRRTPTRHDPNRGEQNGLLAEGPLQQLDDFREALVLGGELFYLADRVQNRGVITPPKRRPISGNDLNVKTFDRNMAICRGLTTFTVVETTRCRSAKYYSGWRRAFGCRRVFTRLGSWVRYEIADGGLRVSTQSGAPLSVAWASKRLTAPSNPDRWSQPSSLHKR